MLEMELNFEIDKIIDIIKTRNLKNIVLQLPDGLKPKADDIISEIKKGCNCNIYLWLNSCYGACDTPNVDYEIIQIGHSQWN